MAPSKKAGKKVTPAKGKTVAAGGGKKAAFAKADWADGFKKKTVGVADMTLLSVISNESINDNLDKRWKSGEIYTYIGPVLISVNPFRDLGIYGDDVVAKYKGRNRLEVPPHVFAIAEGSYYNMQAYKDNQCVIISGESGAGKTEAAKRIMQYIAAVSGSSGSGIQEIKDMVLATNPLLESFGCAKTLRNDNSSRHGKYLEIMFNAHAEPVGAQITNYLLEKNRVVGQLEGERDFHIFYQFTKGASAAQRDAFGLQGPETYVYISRSGCLEVPGIDDVADFGETINAMNVIGLAQDEQDNIFRMLAAVLWLGNISFVENDEGHAQIADTSITDFVAYLLEVDAPTVEKVMVSKIIEAQRSGNKRGSVYESPLNPAQAVSGRDALSKAIYNNLFEWIVSRVNVSMKPRESHSTVIGVLDIYGFEIFQDNSFEQLCINYVNEKLQQIFIELTLKAEQEEYVREQIKWEPIKYFNNKVVCDLIEERRPPGIFAALNDACATAHADPSAADNSFVQRLSALGSNPHFESRGAQFLVKHYAGDVMYSVSGMTDKNKDALVKDLLDLIASSSNSFLQTLFPDRPDPNSKKRPPTAGDKIKSSAGALVENLMRAQPSYIRTIKPNQNRSATEYDTKAILHQIKYLGLQENIRVRRAGFAYRNTFEKMIERFYLLSKATGYAGEYIWQGETKAGCERILKDSGIAREEWQMGVTKSFIKNPETLFALETMRDRYFHNMAARIQRAWRNYWRYKNECARRIQRFWKNNKEGLVYAQIREYGHQVLAQRKERRRFSLLSYRRFMSDYLYISGSDPLGSTIRDAAGISKGEKISFSMRIQLLVSKFGRSSKPSPRYLILTEKAVHIVVNSEKMGMALERKIPLVTIKAIGMSNLRDDWVVLNLGPTEEGDPILSCVLKTELVSTLITLSGGGLSLLVGPTVEYTKKKDKKATISFQRDETIPRDDMYKSHVVHVPTGEPANSVSRPAAKRKPGVVKPITQGKLLRPGGPGGSGASKPAPKPKPAPKAQALPGGQTSNLAKPATFTPAASTVSKPAGRAVPPPPPPPAAAAATQADVEQYRALYDFQGQEGEINLSKDDVVELLEKDDNGWWRVRKDRSEGWAPHNYLEFIPPKPKPVVAPPPPPARRAPPAAPKPNGAATPPVNTAAKPGPSAPKPAALKPTAPKPGAKPPALAPKPPGVGGGKPPVPTAARPVPSPAPKPGGGSKFGGGGAAAGGPGQMDLAAALAKRAQRQNDD